METEEVYYQVTEWNAKSNEFREVFLTKSEDRAQSFRYREEREAAAIARHDNKPNYQYYFISIMSVELVRTMKWKKYEQRLNEAREFILSQYNGEFIPYCQHLIREMTGLLDANTPAELSALAQKQSVLRTSEEEFDSWTKIWLEAKFGNDGSIWLHTLLQRGYDDAREALVNEFVNWESLQKWLKDIEQASKECESKLIDSCADTFRWILDMPKE